MSLTSLITVTFPQDSSYGPNDTFTVNGKNINEPVTGITKSQLESGYLYPHNNEETVGYTVTPTSGECVGQIVLEGDIAVAPTPSPTPSPTPAPATPTPSPTPAPATPTPSPTPAPTPAQFFNYLVTYDETNEGTACDSPTEITVYSQCSPITLPGVGQCFLYNTGNTNDPVSPGYYADVSTGYYYYVENNGLVEEIQLCPASTPTPTPEVVCFLLPVETSATLSDMCNGVTTPEDGYFDTNDIATASIYYGPDSCAEEDAGTKYFLIPGAGAIQYRVWSGGIMSQILTCDSPPE